MKKAVICGMSGKDGAGLAKLLLDRGYSVWAHRQTPKGQASATSPA